MTNTHRHLDRTDPHYTGPNTEAEAQADLRALRPATNPIDPRIPTDPWVQG